MILVCRYTIGPSGLKIENPEQYKKQVVKIKKPGCLIIEEDVDLYENDQMRKYWFACVVRALMKHMGERYTSETDKKRISDLLLIEVGWCEEKPDLHGIVQKVAKSIKHGAIKKEELCEVIDMGIQWLAEQEIQVASKNSEQAKRETGR